MVNFLAFPRRCGGRDSATPRQTGLSGPKSISAHNSAAIGPVFSGRVVQFIHTRSVVESPTVRSGRGSRQTTAVAPPLRQAGMSRTSRDTLPSPRSSPVSLAVSSVAPVGDTGTSWGHQLGTPLILKAKERGFNLHSTLLGSLFWHLFVTLNPLFNSVCCFVGCGRIRLQLTGNCLSSHCLENQCCIFHVIPIERT